MQHTSRQIETVLTPAQEIALAQLLRGETVTKAARKAKVNRTTVHRWLTESGFKSEYNRCREELRNAAQGRLLALADDAVDAIAKALKQGDEKTALQLLRGMDLLNSGRPEIVVNNVPPEPPPAPEPISIAEGQARIDQLLAELEKRQSVLN